MKKLFVISVILLVFGIPFTSAQRGNELVEWESGVNQYQDGDIWIPQCNGTQRVGYISLGPGAEVWTIWTREKRDHDSNLVRFHHHREGTATFGVYGYTFVWDIIERIHWRNGELVDTVRNSNHTKAYFDANGVYATWERGDHNGESYSNFVCLRSNL